MNSLHDILLVCSEKQRNMTKHVSLSSPELFQFLIVKDFLWDSSQAGWMMHEDGFQCVFKKCTGDFHRNLCFPGSLSFLHLSLSARVYMQVSLFFLSAQKQDMFESKFKEIPEWEGSQLIRLTSSSGKCRPVE